MERKVVVLLLSHVRLLETPWTAARQASLSFTISRNLLKLISWWCHPTILSSAAPFSFRLQSFPASGSFPIRWLFASGGQSYWSFSFSISLSNKYSGLVSFRIDSFDLLAVQGTVKSLLQHHSWKASVLQRSVIFMVQLSHPYVTAG